MYFLALSHAPPPLLMEMATKSPVTIVPSSTPPRAIGPRMKPTRMGESTGIAAGTIIFWIAAFVTRSEEHTSELQSRLHLVCRLLLEKKKKPLRPQVSKVE